MNPILRNLKTMEDVQLAIEELYAEILSLKDEIRRKENKEDYIKD